MGGDDDKKYSQEYLDVMLELTDIKNDVKNCTKLVDGMSARVRNSNGAIHDNALLKKWRGSFFSIAVIILTSVVGVLSVCWLVIKIWQALASV